MTEVEKMRSSLEVIPMVLSFEEGAPAFVRCHNAGAIIPIHIGVVIVASAAVEIVATIFSYSAYLGRLGK